MQNNLWGRKLGQYIDLPVRSASEDNVIFVKRGVDIELCEADTGLFRPVL